MIMFRIDHPYLEYDRHICVNKFILYSFFYLLKWEITNTTQCLIYPSVFHVPALKTKRLNLNSKLSDGTVLEPHSKSKGRVHEALHHLA
jgi:hypothetical protein